MVDPVQLEESFKEFSVHLNKWVPDGIIHVDLKLMQELGLLNNAQLDEITTTNTFSNYFHVLETDDKVTLFNEQFAVWIVPSLINDSPTTMTFVSLITNNKPHLELVFSTAGVYNTPRYILKILQHFLSEVIDTETMISIMDKKKSG